MTTSSLRRAGLIVTIVASLSSRAFAQSDAAFASSLGEIDAALAAVSQSKTTPRKRVESQVPSASDAVWQKVLETVKNDGKYVPGTAAALASFSIEEVIGDPKTDHTMHLVGVSGTINENGQFQATNAGLAVMTHTLDQKDGNWHVDFWGFQTDIYGTVIGATHATAVKSPDGEVLSSAPIELNLSDPNIQTQYDAMLKHWAERN